MERLARSVSGVSIRGLLCTKLHGAKVLELSVLLNSHGLNSLST